MNLETAVGPSKKAQDFELESLAMGVDHSLKAKATPIARDSNSKSCAFLPDPATVLRLNFLNAILLIMAIVFNAGCNGRAQADVKKVKAGDVELAYYTRGSGPPLVMIMGFRGTMAVWDPAFLDILEKKHTLILFDNRGVGFSSDTVENLTTIEQMADDTALLMKALNIERADILGWSMGSRIAMELALKNPEKVDHLILCSPSPGGSSRAGGTSKALEKLTADVLTPEEALKLIFPVTEAGKLAAESYYQRLLSDIALGTVPNDIEIKPETVKRQVQALLLWSQNNLVYEQLESIKKPTLVAGGTADDLDNPENVRIVASRIPFAWMAYFEGAGHNFLSQDHQKFGNLVNLFIDR